MATRVKVFMSTVIIPRELTPLQNLFKSLVTRTNAIFSKINECKESFDKTGSNIETFDKDVLTVKEVLEAFELSATKACAHFPQNLSSISPEVPNVIESLYSNISLLERLVVPNAILALMHSLLKALTLDLARSIGVLSTLFGNFIVNGWISAANICLFSLLLCSYR